MAETYEQLLAERDRLRAVLANLVEAVGDVDPNDDRMCRAVGHEVHDMHRVAEPCPVLERIRAALAEAKEAMQT